MTKMVFVFGSNLAGRHGAGAAWVAQKQHGAVYGKGFGHYGNSYALPTKDSRIQTLPLTTVKSFVDDFIHYATEHPELTFQVTQIGCGLAGFKSEEIAPMFAEAPSNCQFDTAWLPWLGETRAYWGHVA